LANIVNGTSTGSGGLITTGDSSDELQLQTAETARVTLTNTAVVVNEGGGDVDFRVEGDTDANLLFVDAGNDRVGVGTNAPTSLVDVVKADTPSVRIRATNDAGTASPALELMRGSNSTFGADGRTDFKIENTGGAFTITSGTSGSVDERMRITSDGYLRMASGSGGIQFNGDSAAANALDDYEEGTFTATLVPSGSGTITLNTVAETMAYTKIGRQVTITGQLIVASSASPTGVSVSLTGLPFSIATLGDIAERTGGAFRFTDSSAVNGLKSFFGAEGLSQLTLEVDASTITSASNAFMFSFSYFTDS